MCRSRPHHLVQSGILKSAQPLRGKDRPVRDRAGEPWRLRTEQNVADLGSDSIGADDEIGLDRCVVFEAEAERVSGLLERDQAMVEGDRSGRHPLFQHGVQVAPMDIEICAAETLLFRRVEPDIVHRRAGIPRAADVALRFDPGLDQVLLEAQTTQHLGGICAENDSSADPREGRRLLVDGRCETRPLQESRHRQTAEARAHDGDSRLSIHRQCSLANVLPARDAAQSNGGRCRRRGRSRRGRARARSRGTWPTPPRGRGGR